MKFFTRKVDIRPAAQLWDQILKRFKLAEITVFWICLFPCCIVAGPLYPLKKLPGQHYLIDQNNVPFFIQGDSPWTLAKQLTTADQDYYISNRWAQGFNAIILDFCPHWGGDGQQEVVNETTNIYGNEPFTNTIDSGLYTNLLSFDPDYFTNVDHVIQKAAQYEMVVVLYPLYDGALDSGEGWWPNMVGNGSNMLYQYGQWVGNRYKNTPNLVYVGAGDFNEPGPPNTLWSAVAYGILSVDTNHLFTAQAGGAAWGNLSARQWYSNDWCNLNCSYPRSPAPGPYITYDFAQTNYQLNPVVPSFSREPFYEFTPYSPENSAYDCRRYAWGSVTYGEAGHFYGNAFISTYGFTTGWQTQIWSQGAIDMANVIKLMQTRPWWNCVPDYSNTTVIGGYGTYGQEDYITCMREAAGKTAIAYIPDGTMTPTVDMTRISSPTANAWWYSPQTGAATLIGNYTTTGPQIFMPPDTNDWVLVLDDASQNYPPPGLTDPEAPTIYVDLTNETGSVGSTVSLGVVASGTAPLGFQWFFNGTNLPGAVSNPLILTNVTSANAGNYQVIVTNSQGAASSFVAMLTVPVPNVISIADYFGNLFQVTVTGTPGQTYLLQYTTNLNSSWQSIGNATMNSSGTFTFYEAAAPISGFFRSACP
ncbi:MAG TPA: DUF4038 domain-containing protein [Verrucomicrobiae bacterium]|nr:DUF4038 domain-containing protein [Verrucomicrobiae bacterium]